MVELSPEVKEMLRAASEMVWQDLWRNGGELLGPKRCPLRFVDVTEEMPP